MSILFYLSFQSVPGSADSAPHIKDDLSLQQLKVVDISDAPPKKVNPEALLSSDMASASSNMASTLTKVSKVICHIFICF